MEGVKAMSKNFKNLKSRWRKLVISSGFENDTKVVLLAMIEYGTCRNGWLSASIPRVARVLGISEATVEDAIWPADTAGYILPVRNDNRVDFNTECLAEFEEMYRLESITKEAA
jgi:hypothetical protein